MSWSHLNEAFACPSRPLKDVLPLLQTSASSGWEEKWPHLQPGPPPGWASASSSVRWDAPQPQGLWEVVRGCSREIAFILENVVKTAGQTCKLFSPEAKAPLRHELLSKAFP